FWMAVTAFPTVLATLPPASAVVSFMLSTVSPSVVVAPFWLLMLPSLRDLEVRNRGDAIPAARIVKRPARDGRAHGVFHGGFINAATHPRGVAERTARHLI